MNLLRTYQFQEGCADERAEDGDPPRRIFLQSHPNQEPTQRPRQTSDLSGNVPIGEKLNRH